MKCPLSNYILEKDDADNEMLVTDCLKEECGWWDDIIEQCCVKTIAWSLSGILGYVSLIEDKMPHEKQFRR